MKKNSTITFVLIEININIVSFSTNKKLQYLFLMKTMVENICSSEKKYYGVVINKSSEGKNIMQNTHTLTVLLYMKKHTITYVVY
jgi:hypothetical protein